MRLMHRNHAIRQQLFDMLIDSPIYTKQPNMASSPMPQNIQHRSRFNNSGLGQVRACWGLLPCLGEGHENQEERETYFVFSLRDSVPLPHIKLDLLPPIGLATYRLPRRLTQVKLYPNRT